MDTWVVTWITDTGGFLGLEVFSTRAEAVRHRRYWEGKHREDASVFIRHKVVDEPTTWENERNQYLVGE